MRSRQSARAAFGARHSGAAGCAPAEAHNLIGQERRAGRNEQPFHARCCRKSYGKRKANNRGVRDSRSTVHGRSRADAQGRTGVDEELGLYPDLADGAAETGAQDPKKLFGAFPVIVISKRAATKGDLCSNLEAAEWESWSRAQ